MKKRILSGLAMLFLMFGATGITSATSFDRTFFNTMAFDDVEIPDTKGYTYTHEILLTDFASELSTWNNLTLNDATLMITHYGNNGHSGSNKYGQKELWLSSALNGSDHIEIGKLSISTSGWYTDTFVLEQDILKLLTDVTDGVVPWSLTINITENTKKGEDSLQISSSILSGHASYDDPSQNPEPATIILFGLGLLGIAGVSRKKLQK